LPGLPRDVGHIIEQHCDWAAGYDAGLKSNDKAKIKADMMSATDVLRL
jgi:hypothetical protein